MSGAWTHIAGDTSAYARQRVENASPSLISPQAQVQVSVHVQQRSRSSLSDKPFFRAGCPLRFGPNQHQQRQAVALLLSLPHFVFYTMVIVCGQSFPDVIDPERLDEVEARSIISRLGQIRKRLSNEDVSLIIAFTIWSSSRSSFSCRVFCVCRNLGRSSRSWRS